jgi:hypothetical protein
MRDLEEAGVDFQDIVSNQLVDEGVKSFAKSYDELIEAIGQKAQRLAGVS